MWALKTPRFVTVSHVRSRGAVEYVCLDFLGGTQTASTISGKLQSLGIDEALKAFELAFPTWSLTAEQKEAQAAA